MDKIPVEILTLLLSAITYLLIDIIPIFQKYKAYVVVIIAGLVCLGLAFTSLTRESIVIVFWAMAGSGTINGVVKTVKNKDVIEDANK